MLKTWIKTLVIIPAFYGCVMAQDPTQLKYAEQLTEASAKKHLSLLASPEFEGRGTGQRGGEKAASYIAEHFKSFGLKAPVNGSYFQPLDLVKRSYAVEHFDIGGKNYANGKDFYVQGENDLAKFDASEIVFIGYGIQDAKYNDLKSIDIKGKIVLVLNEGEPSDNNGNYLVSGSNKPSEWSTSRLKRVQELLKREPKLILAASSAVPQMIERFGNRLTAGRFMLNNEKTETVSTPPVVNITLEVANTLLSKRNTNVESQKKKPETFSIPVSSSIEMGIKNVKLTDPNVLGLLEGTDLKQEIVVISGHYDHDGISADGTIFPGADDNGSGTVGVLELAKVFSEAKKAGKAPRRSILFIGFAAEEKGLLGSQFYSENPVFPLSSTVTCLNMDMIGRIDDKHLNGNHNYLHVIGSDKLSSELAEINKKANELYTQMELDYMYDDPKDNMRIYYRSDQYNFAKHNIPVTFYFSGLHPHYHTPDDTVDKINFPMMVKREQLVFHVAWEIANRDKRLAVDSHKE